MRTDLARRTRALEARHHVDLVSDEEKKQRRFCERLSVQELRQLCEITDRTEAGGSLTVEEQQFVDGLFDKYFF